MADWGVCAASRYGGVFLALAVAEALLPAPAQARQDWNAIPIAVTHVRGDVYAVLGTGANQSIHVGQDGLLVVDAGYAELGDRLVAAIRGVGGADPEAGHLAYLVDTHWHFDHVGANGTYAEAGATVVAHEAAAALMAEDQIMSALGGLEVAATPLRARPGLLFSTAMEFARFGDTVDVVHAPRAHTSGDVVVYFRAADVVHVGDIFFNGMYPFIDVDHGGSLEGMVAACDQILEHSGEATLFIPGHGPLADRADFEHYADMLRTVHRRVSDMVGRGMSREQVIAAKPTADLDAAWSRGGGFNEPDVWVGIVYDGYRWFASGGTSLPPSSRGNDHEL